MTTNTVDYDYVNYVRENRKIKNWINSDWGNLVFCAFGMALLTPLVPSAIYTWISPDFATSIVEITEELGKAAACWFGGVFAIIYTLFFSIGELFFFIEEFGDQYASAGWYWNYVGYRVLCIVDHLSFTAIHYFGYRHAKKYSKKSDRIWFRLAVFSVATLYHIAHNEFIGEWVIKTFFLN